MNLRAQINEIADKIKGDRQLFANFRADPEKTVEDLIDGDYPEEEEAKIVKGVQVSMSGERLFRYDKDNAKTDPLRYKGRI